MKYLFHCERWFGYLDSIENDGDVLNLRNSNGVGHVTCTLILFLCYYVEIVCEKYKSLADEREYEDVYIGTFVM